MNTNAAGIPLNFPGFVMIIVLAFVNGELKLSYFLQKITIFYLEHVIANPVRIEVQKISPSLSGFVGAALWPYLSKSLSFHE